MYQLKSFLVLFIACLFLATGCASFKGEMIPEIETFPSPPNPKPRVQFKVHWRTFINGSEIKDQTPRYAAIHAEELAQDVFKESNMFAKSGTQVPNPDLVITIRIQDQGSGNMAEAFLTGLTLYLWPSSATDHYVLDADVVQPATGKTFTYHLEDEVVLHQQLFLIFLTPFKFPFSVPDQVIENLFANLLIEMERDGALNMQADRLPNEVHAPIVPATLGS